MVDLETMGGLWLNAVHWVLGGRPLTVACRFDLRLRGIVVSLDAGRSISGDEEQVSAGHASLLGEVCAAREGDAMDGEGEE